MKKERIAVLLLLVLAAGSLAAYQFLSPKPVEGAKEITVNVDHLAGEDTSFTFTTQAEYLRQALEEQELAGPSPGQEAEITPASLFPLEEQELAAGEESEYGLWVQTVDGETADESKQEWWGYDINGVQAEYGVDSQPIADGDVILFTLHVGW